jgi:hypothetical protein
MFSFNSITRKLPMTIPGLNRDDAKPSKMKIQEKLDHCENLLTRKPKGVGQQEVHVLGALAAA